MTSHQIAIAKASFSAGLLRPDPTSVPRDEITYFHDALDRTLARCSPANIQTCKSWLLGKVIPSAKRVGVLGKYLAALAVSFESGNEQQEGAVPARNKGKTSRRKRLHILYLLNDLLHHTKYHGQNPSAFTTLSSALQPFMVELFDLAAGYDREKYPKHHRRLNDLLDIWGSNGYYSPDYIHKLRQTLENASSIEAINAKAASKDDMPLIGKKTTPKDPPYVMPATHGDASSPWHELPAGNLMPLIVPNSSTPIRSSSVKPLQFLAGPADESLVKAVKSLLKDVDRTYSSSGSMLDNETIVDIDELGQRVTRDEATGDIIEADGYYGWSRSFCQKMKGRRDGIAGSRSPSRGRSSSRSEYRGRSGSFGSQKKRRFSESSGDGDRFRSRSRNSSRNRVQRRRYSASRSQSRSRSRSRRRYRSRSRSYSPRPRSARETPYNGQQPPYARPPPPPATPQNSIQPPFPGAPNAPQNMQSQVTPPPGMFPTPPPRPPNYHGPWPPPPPPIPPHVPPGSALPPNMGMGMNMNMGMMNMNMAGYGSSFPAPNGGLPFPPPPPPPPPPGPSHGHPYPRPFPYPQPHASQGTRQSYNQSPDQGSGRGGHGGGRGGWNRGG